MIPLVIVGGLAALTAYIFLGENLSYLQKRSRDREPL